ncbi:MAG: polysaccharide deacetylase family protein [Candidatus Woesearchaeota archaeon]
MRFKEKTLLTVSKLSDIFFYKNQVPILYYHRVNNLPSSIDGSPNVDFFHHQIQLLYQRGYYFASLKELIKWCKGLIDLPKNSIAITFDDGYEDNYTNVFPILKKYNAKATIFLIYNYIGRTRYFSYNRPTPQKILAEDYNPSTDLKHKYLNVNQIKEMFDSNLIDFGSHTLSHSSLVYCDINIAKEEIKGSKEALEKLLNIPIETFCYPYGHYNNTIKKITRKAGYLGAFTTKKKKISKGEDCFAMPRWHDINLLINLPPILRKIHKLF